MVVLIHLHQNIQDYCRPSEKKPLKVYYKIRNLRTQGLIIIHNADNNNESE